jgi:hypothetical protein
MYERRRRTITEKKQLAADQNIKDLYIHIYIYIHTYDM